MLNNVRWAQIKVASDQCCALEYDYLRRRRRFNVYEIPAAQQRMASRWKRYAGYGAIRRRLAMNNSSALPAVVGQRGNGFAGWKRPCLGQRSYVGCWSSSFNN